MNLVVSKDDDDTNKICPFASHSAGSTRTTLVKSRLKRREHTKLVVDVIVGVLAAAEPWAEDRTRSLSEGN